MAKFYSNRQPITTLLFYWGFVLAVNKTYDTNHRHWQSCLLARVLGLTDMLFHYIFFHYCRLKGTKLKSRDYRNLKQKLKLYQLIMQLCWKNERYSNDFKNLNIYPKYVSNYCFKSLWHFKVFPSTSPIWQDQMSRLSKENGSLKQNLEATKAAMNVSRSESAKALLNGVNVHEVLDLW